MENLDVNLHQELLENGMLQFVLVLGKPSILLPVVLLGFALKISDIQA